MLLASLSSLPFVLSTCVPPLSGELRKGVGAQEAANSTMATKLAAMTDKISAQGLALKIDATRASASVRRGQQRESRRGSGACSEAEELKLPALT
jgi:hypothetical protein